MKFVNIETKQIIKDEKELRLLFPNTSFPQIIVEKSLPKNIQFLYDGLIPPTTDLQSAIEDGVELNGDKWITKWKVVDRFSTKVDKNTYLDKLNSDKWVIIKAKRDKLLSESDWVVTKSLELGMPVPPQWINYRQMLRDITLVNDPDKVVFPSLPK
jgi:hypothetical protein